MTLLDCEIAERSYVVSPSVLEILCLALLHVTDLLNDVQPYWLGTLEQHAYEYLKYMWNQSLLLHIPIS